MMPNSAQAFSKRAAFFFFSSAALSFRSHGSITSVHQVLKTYLLYHYLTSYNQSFFFLLLNWRHFKLFIKPPHFV